MHETRQNNTLGPTCDFPELAFTKSHENEVVEIEPETLIWSQIKGEENTLLKSSKRVAGKTQFLRFITQSNLVEGSSFTRSQ